LRVIAVTKLAIRQISKHFSLRGLPWPDYLALVCRWIGLSWLRKKSKLCAESIAPLALASSTEDEAEAVVWLNTSARTVKGELLLLDSGIHLGGSSKAQIPSKTACTSRVHKLTQNDHPQ